MLKLATLLAFVAISHTLNAQNKPVIPLMRKIFHENIDKQQQLIDRADKKEDKAFNYTRDEEVNLQLTYSLFHTVDEMQDEIELDSTLEANNKIKYLRGLNEVLASFEADLRTKTISAEQFPDLIRSYQNAMELDRTQQSILPVVEQGDLEIGNILIKSFAFQRNEGFARAKDVLLMKTVRKYPERIVSVLNSNPNMTGADSLIKVAARTRQEEIYSYAQSLNNGLGKRIRANNDPLVQTIAKLAQLNEGRMYFPFLDKMYTGKLSMEEIDKSRTDNVKYYRLLVNTEIDYMGRLRRRDTPMAMDALTGMLRQKAIEEFINVINGLHDEPDNVRMRRVEPLTPQELYYLCVMGEEVIYTSSYLKVYERIFQRMKSPNSDTLLMSVNFDHFKKFIKMAANYNTLDNFLSRMDKGNAEILMKAFAAGLEKTGTLEDAVDVADSYASISDTKLRQLILSEIQTNLAKQSANEGKRAYAIYDLLNSIFLSLDSTNHVDLSQKFGIPSIYFVRNGELKNDAGRIIIQQFFYGDKDGTTYFELFKSPYYKNPNWKLVNKPEWVEISSTRGVPMTIYANKALDEKQGLDEKAQEALKDYLNEHNLNPTIVIHRGHSYHVSSTIAQLYPSSKVVLLGSCGGYQSINQVLSICPYAHIIASKQTGSGAINGPMIMSITETLREGKDLNWPEMWRTLGRQLKDNPLFEDYIPPYKNLGALFLMAYNRVMEG